MKSLERSNDKMLGGVCAGLAKSVNINPILLRVLSVIAVLFTGLYIGGVIILAYLLGWIIIPNEQKPKTLEIHDKGSIQEGIEENHSEIITEIPDKHTQEEIEENHSTSLKIITSPVKKLLIIGACGLVGGVIAVGMVLAQRSPDYGIEDPGFQGSLFILLILFFQGFTFGGVLGVIVVFLLNGSERRLIVGACGLIGLVAGGIVGFSMVGSSAGNVLIPILGIIGLITGGVLGIIAAAIKKQLTLHKMH